MTSVLVVLSNEELPLLVRDRLQKQKKELDSFLAEAKRIKAKIDLDQAPKKGVDGIYGWIVLTKKILKHGYGSGVYDAALHLLKTTKR